MLLFFSVIILLHEMRLTLTSRSEDTFAMPARECSVVCGYSVTDPARVEGAAMLLKRASMTAKEAPTSSAWGFRQKRIKSWLLSNNNSTVDVPIYRPVVARPKISGKQGKPVKRYTGENARTCTRRADVSPQTSIWRVCVSPAAGVVACNYSIISARVCNTAVH